MQTTLVKYILEEQHGHRIAVILNEFGEETGIESAFVQDGQVRPWHDWLETIGFSFAVQTVSGICFSVEGCGPACFDRRQSSTTAASRHRQLGPVFCHRQLGPVCPAFF
jgi:hypothetical protein